MFLRSAYLWETIAFFLPLFLNFRFRLMFFFNFNFIMLLYFFDWHFLMIIPWVKTFSHWFIFFDLNLTYWLLFQKIFKMMACIFLLDWTLSIFEKIPALKQQLLRCKQTFLIWRLRLGSFELGLLNWAKFALFEVKLLKAESMFGQWLSLLIAALTKLNIFELFDRIVHRLMIAGLFRLIEVLIKDALLILFQLLRFPWYILLMVAFISLIFSWGINFRVILIKSFFGLLLKLPLSILFIVLIILVRLEFKLIGKEYIMLLIVVVPQLLQWLTLFLLPT